MLSDDLARPSFQPFHVEAVYEWIECDLKKYPGFKIEVRMNLKNRERKKLNDLIDDVDNERQRISDNSLQKAKELDARKANALEDADAKALEQITEERVALLEAIAAAHDHNAARVNAAIAPYIRDWNLAIRDDSGTVADIPPPAVAGLDAFEDLDLTLVNWIIKTLMEAYRGGKGFNGSPLTVDEPDALTSASNETTPNAELPISPSESAQPSPESSRSRSRSRSKT